MLWSWLACGPRIDPGVAPALRAAEPAPLLVRPVDGAPDVYFQAMVAAGSAHDPVGAEGLANLVARGLTEAGAGERDSAAVDAASWPTANGFQVLVDRDWVSLRLRCHADQAELCADLFTDALVRPRFDEADVLRLRERTLARLTDGLLGDEERLAREVLEAVLYEGHPYGHPVEGRAGVLPTLGPDELRRFHREHYLRSTVFAGVAGAVTPELADRVRGALDALPPGLAPDAPLQRPVEASSHRLVAVDTATPVTGFWLGRPLALDRNDPDWPAMYVATMALGAHRSSFGRLFGVLRAERGLNYGDYAYLEAWSERSDGTWQDQGTLRRQNRFAVWIRPTSIDNGPRALGLAMDEVRRWKEEGLSAEEFEDVRSFLRATLPVLAATPGRRLAYELEALATGTPDLQATLAAQLDALTVEQVNETLERRVELEAWTIVAVTGEADALVATLTSGSVETAGDPAPPTLAPADAWTLEADGLFR